MPGNTSQFVGWAQAASGLGAICLVMLAILLKKMWDGSNGVNTYADKIGKEIKAEIANLLSQFDALCQERQKSCRQLQDLSNINTCRKLETHIQLSKQYKDDTKVELTKMEEEQHNRWCQLNRRREQDWAQHERIMKEIWDAINKHSHEGIEGSGAVLRKD